MDINHLQINKQNAYNYPFMSTDITTKIFNSNNTGPNFSIDVLTGEQQYDMNNVYELSLNNHDIDNGFNLEKSLKKLKNTFERTTRYSNSRVAAMNREIISKTFDDLLNSTEVIKSSRHILDKQMIEYPKNDDTIKQKGNREQRKSKSCLNLKRYTTSSSKLKWNRNFFKRLSSINITSSKYPAKTRTQILRQKDIALRYKQYFKPTTFVSIKQKPTYTEKLKLLERSSINNTKSNVIFIKNKKPKLKRHHSVYRSCSKINTTIQISPLSKLKSKNISKSLLSNTNKRLRNKLLTSESFNTHVIAESNKTFNENKQNTCTFSLMRSSDEVNKLLGLEEKKTIGEKMENTRNLNNFSTQSVNTTSMNPLSAKHQYIQTENDLNVGRPTADAQSQTLPVICYYTTDYFHEVTKTAGVNMRKKFFKEIEKSSLQFQDIESSFKNICSVLSIKSSLINKADKENVDSNKCSKSSSSSVNILQMYGINTDNFKNGDKKFSYQMENSNCSPVEEKNNLSLEQIHLNRSKILNMEIHTSNEESIKIPQAGSVNNKSGSSHKSYTSSSDELYQAIRSKIDRVLNGRPSFSRIEKLGDDIKTKKSCLQHREEFTKIANEKNGHYVSKSLSRDSLEAISKCGKHSKMNNSCKLIKTLAYRIQKLEIKALHEQSLRLKQQKRLDLLENYLRDLYMLSLSNDKTTVKTLTAIKKGLSDLDSIHEKKFSPITSITQQKYSSKELFIKHSEPDSEHFNASNNQYVRSRKYTENCVDSNI